MWIERELVMLPANEAAIKAPHFAENHIVKCIREWTPIGESTVKENTLTWCVNHNEGVLKHYQPQHLYILSDEEIKKGDWFIRDGKLYNEFKTSLTPSVTIFIRLYPNLDLSEQWREVYLTDCKKIIATTDTSLATPKEKAGENVWTQQLLQLQKSFIEHFISEYNKGSLIDKVKVEYYFTHETNGDKPLCAKINPDNTIKVKTIKDSFTREDMINAYIQGAKDYCASPLSIDPFLRLQPNKWIEENL